MKRILFVADESQAPDGIRRMLDRNRDLWEAQFAPSAEQALTVLDRSSFDVVISDIRMTGMDGAAFLSQVQKRFPETARIVLSSYSEPALTARAASVAHRVLASPCDGPEMQEAIERLLAFRSLIASPKIRKIVGSVGELPALSATYSSLTSALNDPFAGIEEVVAIIERDVAMAAKVLQLTNSAFFGLPQQVTNLPNAVSYLGMVTMKNLALASEAFRLFRPDARIPASVCDGLVTHATEVAAIAGALPLPSQVRDLATIAGLLHDIGKLFLASAMPDEFCAVAARVNESGSKWHETEEEILGISHAEIGAYLLGLWGIPDLVVEAIAFHHHPDRIPHSHFDCSEAIFVADLLAHELEAAPEADGARQIEEEDRDLLEKLDLVSRMEEFRELAAKTKSL